MTKRSHRVVRLGLSVASGAAQAVALGPDDELLASVACATPPGIDDAIRHIVPRLLAELGEAQVSSVMLASAELRDRLRGDAELARVGVLRIGTTTTAIPPLSGWPREIAARMSGPQAIVAGGHDFDGAPLTPLDVEAIARFAASCEGKVDSIAISSVFAPIAPDPELEAAALVTRALRDRVPVTLSHSVGGFGLLERENAAILNSSLSLAGRAMIDGLHEALRDVGLSVELFIAQNDGTLLGSDAAAAMPIRVLDSRLATSIRGAALLSGVEDAIVLDFDDEEPLAGIMRDNDVALEYGLSSFAGVRVIQYLPLAFDSGTRTDPVERLSRYARHSPVLAVGRTAEFSEALAAIDPSPAVPAGAELASALGAATAPVSSAVWQFIGAGGDREALLLSSRQRAIDEAILAGADPSTTVVVAVHETPLSYMTGEPRRLFVRAAGRPFSVASDPQQSP